MKRISFPFPFVVVVLFLGLSFNSCKKTCEDGKLNQDEVEIDCGGICEPCAQCNDGIQNGSETAVDCGGTCADCATVYPYQPIASPVTQDLNVVVCEGQNCASIGSEGVLIVSKDKGASWQKAAADLSGLQLVGVELIDGIIYLCGTEGLIKKSTDLGASFMDIPVANLDIKWNGLLFFDQDSGLVCGENLSIYYTNDGGQNWNRARRSPSAERDFYAMSSPEKNVVYAIGDNSVQLSQNNGRNWTQISLSSENPNMENFLDLHYYSSSRAFATGEASMLFSTNSIEWYDKAVYTSFGGVSFFKDYGLYAGRDVDNKLGKVIESLDSGVTWTQIPMLDETARFNDCFIIDESNSIIVGEKGVILRR